MSVPAIFVTPFSWMNRKLPAIVIALAICRWPPLISTAT